VESAPVGPPVSSTFGTLGGVNKYAGGCLANTGYIYAAPFDSNNFLKIKPANDTFTTLGSGSIGTVSARCNGIVRAGNECLYTIPQADSQIRKIDPATDTITSFGSLGSSVGKWSGGCLAPNGFIYGIPHNSSQVLKIDPSTDTISTFGSVGTGFAKWVGGALAPNGKIYCAPNSSVNTVLVIDTSNDSTYTISIGSNGYYGCVLGKNGKVYLIPANSTAIIEIDPITDIAILLTSTVIGANKWFCGTVTPFGKILGSQFSQANLLQIDPSLGNISLVSSPGVGYVGSVLAENGAIYNIPLSATTIKKITNIGAIKPSMYTLPSPLTSLGSSAFNVHQNKY
jgi:streptogramin lyase